MQTIETLLPEIWGLILQPLILLLFGIAFVYFLWGVFEFIRDAGSNTGREKGKQHIIWGIIGMVIMLSVFGIVKVVANTLGNDATQQIPPQFQD